MHTDKIVKSLDNLKSLSDAVLKQGLSVLKAGDNKLYPLDLVVMGIVKRCLSTTSAIENMVVNGNLTCARAILRMHLDTVLRLSAFWLSKDPHEMASKVLSGDSIGKMKDKDNKKMTDLYLAKCLGINYEWVPEVYKRTCGYIHFSESHVFASISEFDVDGVLNISVSQFDEKYPESSWLEITGCASECLEIVNYYLEGYGNTKDLVASGVVLTETPS